MSVTTTTETAGPWVPADTFGMRLLRLRKSMRMTSADIAALCNVKTSTWQNWERGTNPLGMAEVVRNISAATGCDRGWLMWGLSETSDYLIPADVADALAENFAAA